MIRLRFLGAAGTVTGSKYLLELDGTRLLIDCGLHQGLKSERLRNWRPLDVDPRSVDAMLLTHAHIDHTGYVPRFTRDGYGGPIYATPATVDLLQLMLPDSGRLQEEDAAYHNKRGTSKHKPAEPLYTAAEAELAARRATAVPYDQPLTLGRGLTVRFRRAGHILGSASVHIEHASGRRIVFSGDVGRYDAPILPDPATIDEADYVVVESTYGNREHDPEPIGNQLLRVIDDALARRGVLVVPAFAIGRTQELLFHLAALQRDGRIPHVPTFVDSPMAISATDLYVAHPEDFDGDMRRLTRENHSPLEPREFRVARSREESQRINEVRGPAIVISASGMATGGRILHHLMQRLPDGRNTILLVGFQAAGTRGRSLQEGARTVRIFGDDVPVRARVETIHGLSAHADASGLVRWLNTARHQPSQVFVTHGEEDAAQALRTRIDSEMTWQASVPHDGDTAVLT